MAEFDNKERRRYYGLRVGDTVRLLYGPRPEPVATVIEYGIMDNNAVYVRLHSDDRVIKWTAEHCDIITKVEDQ